MIFGLPWKLGACIAGVVLLAGFFLWADHAAYMRGVSAERQRWETRAAQVHSDTQQAITEIASRSHAADAAINSALAHGREAIQALPDEADARTVLLAWADADRRLCDAAGPGACGNYRA